MGFEEIKFWSGLAFQGLNALATFGVWLYVRYGDRNQKVDGEFKRVDEQIQKTRTSIGAGLASVRADMDRRLDEQDKVIARLSGLIEHAPTHDDLGDLYDKVNKTANAVAQMAGELKGLNENLRLILSNITEKGMR